ncbi:hypothetical protein [Thiomonas sp. FB-6]|nr:hypothetical protein [Thiomonas sp. FB-6]
MPSARPAHLPLRSRHLAAWLAIVAWIAYTGQRLWLFQLLRHLPGCGG